MSDEPISISLKSLYKIEVIKTEDGPYAVITILRGREDEWVVKLFLSKKCLKQFIRDLKWALKELERASKEIIA